MIDVLEEEWDPQRGDSAVAAVWSAATTTSCGSRRPARKHAWRFVAAEVSAADRAAGVTVRAAEGRDGIRVTIDSAADRDVAWTVRFKTS